MGAFSLIVVINLLNRMQNGQEKPDKTTVSSSSKPTTVSNKTTKKQRRHERKLASGIPSASQDAFEKINYLHQAASLLSHQLPQCPEFGRYYMYNTKQLCQKMCLKVDPAIKQQSCKFCFTYFKPGENTSLSIKEHGKRKFCEVKCLTCKKVKRYPLEFNK